MVRWLQGVLITAIAALTFALCLEPVRSSAEVPAYSGEGSGRDEGESMCLLSEQESEEASKAFAAMMPTFTHPRCINCHGAINPFEPNTRHIGGRVGKSFSQRTFTDEALERDVTVFRSDDEDIKRQCQDCHSGFQGKWFMPPPPIWFVGKSPLQLCRQIKRETGGDPESFLRHIEHDGPDPFILEAFRGTRGLDDNGQAVYQNETGRDFRPEPPPITHARFLEQARAWVEAVGDGFLYANECGCRPLKYALELTYTLEMQGGSKLNSEVKAILPLKFIRHGEFTGETSVPAVTTVSIHTAHMDCKDSHIRNTANWKVTGSVIPREIRMPIKLSLSMPPAQFEAQTCTAGGHTYTVPAQTGNATPEFNLAAVDLEPLVGFKASVPQSPYQKLEVKLVEQQ